MRSAYSAKCFSSPAIRRGHLRAAIRIRSSSSANLVPAHAVRSDSASSKVRGSAPSRNRSPGPNNRSAGRSSILIRGTSTPPSTSAANAFSSESTTARSTRPFVTVRTGSAPSRRAPATATAWAEETLDADRWQLRLSPAPEITVAPAWVPAYSTEQRRGQADAVAASTNSSRGCGWSPKRSLLPSEGTGGKESLRRGGPACGLGELASA